MVCLAHLSRKETTFDIVRMLYSIACMTVMALALNGGQSTTSLHVYYTYCACLPVESLLVKEFRGMVLSC